MILAAAHSFRPANHEAQYCVSWSIRYPEKGLSLDQGERLAKARQPVNGLGLGVIGFRRPVGSWRHGERGPTDGGIPANARSNAAYIAPAGVLKFTI